MGSIQVVALLLTASFGMPTGSTQAELPCDTAAKLIDAGQIDKGLDIVVELAIRQPPEPCIADVIDRLTSAAVVDEEPLTCRVAGALVAADQESEAEKIVLEAMKTAPELVCREATVFPSAPAEIEIAGRELLKRLDPSCEAFRNLIEAGAVAEARTILNEETKAGGAFVCDEEGVSAAARIDNTLPWLQRQLTAWSRRGLGLGELVVGVLAAIFVLRTLWFLIVLAFRYLQQRPAAGVVEIAVTGGFDEKEKAYLVSKMNGHLAESNVMPPSSDPGVAGAAIDMLPKLVTATQGSALVQAVSDVYKRWRLDPHFLASVAYRAGDKDRYSATIALERKRRLGRSRLVLQREVGPEELLEVSLRAADLIAQYVVSTWRIRAFVGYWQRWLSTSQDGFYHFRLAQRMTDPSEKLAALRSVAAREPRNAVAWQWLGDAEWNCGRPDRAAEAYLEALLIEDELLGPRYSLATVLSFVDEWYDDHGEEMRRVIESRRYQPLVTQVGQVLESRANALELGSWFYETALTAVRSGRARRGGAARELAGPGMRTVFAWQVEISASITKLQTAALAGGAVPIDDLGRSVEDLFAGSGIAPPAWGWRAHYAAASFHAVAHRLGGEDTSPASLASAIAHLQNALADPEFPSRNMKWVRVGDPDLASIRSTPEFQALLLTYRDRAT